MTPEYPFIRAEGHEPGQQLGNWRLTSPSFLREHWTDWHAVEHVDTGQAAVMRIMQVHGSSSRDDFKVTFGNQLQPLRSFRGAGVAPLLDSGVGAGYRPPLPVPEDWKEAARWMLAQRPGHAWYVLDCDPRHLTLAEHAQVGLDRNEATALIEELGRILSRAHACSLYLRPETGAILMTRTGPVILYQAWGNCYTLLTAMARTWPCPPPGVRIFPPEEQPSSWATPDLGPAGDQYRLAAVAFHLLRGRWPFPSRSTWDAFFATYQAPHDPESGAFDTDFPPATARVFLRAFRQAPSARYPSVEAFVAALLESLPEPPPPAQPSQDRELLRAVTTRALARTRELLAAGANPNCWLEDRHILELEMDDETRAALLEAGSWSPPLRDQLLIWAVDHNRPDSVRALARAGADVAAETTFGTPLQLASLLGRRELVESLLEAGAHPNVVGSGMSGTPLELALRWDHEEVAQLLRDRGAIA